LPDRRTDATTSLLEHASGDATAAERLLPLVYDRLRALAGKYMREERAGHTLQPTALVHEAYMRLIDLDRVDWKSKSHFCAMAARQMRRVLVEHARRAVAKKRGQRPRRVTLADDVGLVPRQVLDPIVLTRALDRLEDEHPRQCRVVELRFFAGMEIKEIAYVLDVSPTTVKQDWRFAKAWLSRALGPAGGNGG
jgi:RNA polymerase sigma factor (TIGR02999 family)